MSSLTTHLARRGVELAHATITGADNGDDEGKPNIQVSGLAMFVFALTFLAFIASIGAVSCLFGFVPQLR